MKRIVQKTKSFKSLDGSFSVTAMEGERLELRLGEYFNCPRNDTVGDVLKAMGKEEIPAELLSKHGKGIKKRELFIPDDEDWRGINFIEDFIAYLNSIPDAESHWQLFTTMIDEEESVEELNYLRGLNEHIWDEEFEDLIDVFFADSRFDYLIWEVQIFVEDDI
jgi:hypothetical protein